MNVKDEIIILPVFVVKRGLLRSRNYRWKVFQKKV